MTTLYAKLYKDKWFESDAIWYAALARHREKAFKKAK